MTDILERQIALDDCELRTAADGDGLTLTGYAAVFDAPARINSWEGNFDEVIARGAFKKTIRERKPIMQWNHGKDPAVGQVPIGSIVDLKEDARGLHVTARLHDNHAVQPIRDAIASGAVGGMSIRMQVINDHWKPGPEVQTRTIREIRLFELGPVDLPAYAETSVGVRNHSEITDPAAPAPGTADPNDAPPESTRQSNSPGFLRFVAQIEALRSPRRAA